MTAATDLAIIATIATAPFAAAAIILTILDRIERGEPMITVAVLALAFFTIRDTAVVILDRSRR